MVVGDKVLIRKTDGKMLHEISWVSSMDKYDGTIQVIDTVFKNGVFSIKGWSFVSEWLILINEIHEVW